MCSRQRSNVVRDQERLPELFSILPLLGFNRQHTVALSSDPYTGKTGSFSLNGKIVKTEKAG